MQTYPKAFDAEHVHSLIDSNEFGPDCTVDMAKRLCTLASQRADVRNDTAFDGGTPCLIATTWVGFCEDNFGYDDGSVNHYAIGVHKPDVSMTKGADLFVDVHVVQQGWLETGDGRRTELQIYTDEFDGTNDGEMWLPDGRQEYVAVIELSEDIVYDGANASDAM